MRTMDLKRHHEYIFKYYFCLPIGPMHVYLPVCQSACMSPRLPICLLVYMHVAGLCNISFYLCLYRCRCLVHLFVCLCLLCISV